MPRRAGFTLPEAIIVIVIASALSSAAIYLTTREAAPGSEAAAQARIWTAYQTQTTAALTRQAPAGAQLLAEMDRGGTYTDEASTDQRTVSVSVTGTAAHMGVLGPDGSCWAVRYDARPRGTSHATWAVILPAAGLPCDMRDELLRGRIDEHASTPHPFERPAIIGAQ